MARRQSIDLHQIISAPDLGLPLGPSAELGLPLRLKVPSPPPAPNVPSFCSGGSVDELSSRTEVEDAREAAELAAALAARTLQPVRRTASVEQASCSSPPPYSSPPCLRRMATSAASAASLSSNSGTRPKLELRAALQAMEAEVAAVRGTLVRRVSSTILLDKRRRSSVLERDVAAAAPPPPPRGRADDASADAETAPALPSLLRQCSTNEQKLLLYASLEAMETEVAAVRQLLLRAHSSSCPDLASSYAKTAPAAAAAERPCVGVRPIGVRPIGGAAVPPCFAAESPPPPPPPPLQHRVSSRVVLRTPLDDAAAVPRGAAGVANRAIRSLQKQRSSGLLAVQRALDRERRCPTLQPCRNPLPSSPLLEAASTARAATHSDGDASERLAALSRSAPAATQRPHLSLAERSTRSESRLLRFRQALVDAATPRCSVLLDRPSRRLIDWGCKKAQRRAAEREDPVAVLTPRARHKTPSEEEMELPRELRTRRRRASIARWEFAGLRDHGLICLDPAELKRAHQQTESISPPGRQSHKLRRLRELALAV